MTIKKKIELEVLFPDGFDEVDELGMDISIADTISEMGGELVETKPYNTIEDDAYSVFRITDEDVKTVVKDMGFTLSDKGINALVDFLEGRMDIPWQEHVKAGVEVFVDRVLAAEALRRITDGKM